VSRLAALTRSGRFALATLLVVSLGLAAVEARRPRAETPSTVRAHATVRLPPGAGRGVDLLATDSDRDGGLSVWAFRHSGRRLTVRVWRPTRRGFRIGRVHVVDLGTAGPWTADVTRWRGKRAIVTITPVGDRYRVVVLPILSGGVAAEGTTPPVPRRAGHDRDLAIATWGGALPDLFVVDRSRRRSSVTVRVISGESGFRKEVLRTTTAVANLPARLFALDVGSVNSATAALAFFTLHAPTGSRRTEVHVIPGPTFEAFGEQAPLGMPDRAAAGRRFLLAHAGDQTYGFAFDLSRRRVDVLGL
jgi:hypothetical protein